MDIRQERRPILAFARERPAETRAGGLFGRVGGPVLGFGGGLEEFDQGAPDGFRRGIACEVRERGIGV